MLAFELEGKVIGQMPAFMVTSKQPECIWIPDLQGPEVKYALEHSQWHEMHN